MKRDKNGNFIKDGIIKKCLTCGVDFYVTWSIRHKRKFCSHACYSKNAKGKLKVKYNVNRKHKICNQCNKKYSIDNFYKHSISPDGLKYICKQCSHDRARKQYHKNIDKTNKHYRAYYQKNKERIVKYSRNWRLKNQDKCKKTNDNYTKRHPQVKKVNSIFNNAIISGKIKRKPCVVCGEKKSDGHHEDYNKPLDVIWLCRKHHLRKHYKIN